MSPQETSARAELRRSWRRVAVFVALVTAGAWLATLMNSRRAAAPADASTLRRDFNRDAAAPAILAILGPEESAPFSALCEILARSPRAAVRVFIVWKAAPAHPVALPDPRVRQYADLDGAVAAAAASVLGKESIIAWYDPGAMWKDTPPVPEINIPARGADLRPLAARLAASP